MKIYKKSEKTKNKKLQTPRNKSKNQDVSPKNAQRQNQNQNKNINKTHATVLNNDENTPSEILTSLQVYIYIYICTYILHSPIKLPTLFC